MKDYSGYNPMDEVEFYLPSKTQYRSNSDVSVSLSKGNGLYVVFRDGLGKRIGDRVVYGIVKNRMIFKAHPQGWKMCECSNHHDNRLQIVMRSAKQAEEAKGFIGDYSVQYDDTFEYYYIEKGE